MYAVFVRNRWKPGLRRLRSSPKASKTVIAKGIKTESEARFVCKVYNAAHPMSRKAEFKET